MDTEGYQRKVEELERAFTDILTVINLQPRQPLPMIEEALYF